MTIGPDFVFVAIPRTASTAMARFLLQFGGRNIGHHHARTAPSEHRDKFTFSVVRNPYDRLLSIWYHLRRCDTEFNIAQMSFPEWMDFMVTSWGWGGWNQTLFLADSRVDRVLRYEKLASDVPDLPFNKAVKWPKRRINAEERPDWQQDLLQNPAWVPIIEAHSEPDFEQFGYGKL